MSKSLMISIQPKHLVNILNGNKTLELRKTVPKDFKGWVYIYCTKGGGLLVDNTSWINYLIVKDFVKKDYTESPRFHIRKKLEEHIYGSVRNTKVVARFWFDEYAELNPNNFFGGNVVYYENYSGKEEHTSDEEQSGVIDIKFLEKITQVSLEDIQKYSKSKYIYGWHIKKLEIFDTPLSLSDFYKATLYATGQVIKEYEEQTNDFKSYRLQRPPQSWQYIYKREE